MIMTFLPIYADGCLPGKLNHSGTDKQTATIQMVRLPRLLWCVVAEDVVGEKLYLRIVLVLNCQLWICRILVGREKQKYDAISAESSANRATSYALPFASSSILSALEASFIFNICTWFFRRTTKVFATTGQRLVRKDGHFISVQGG